MFVFYQQILVETLTRRAKSVNCAFAKWLLLTSLDIVNGGRAGLLTWNIIRKLQSECSTSGQEKTKAVRRGNSSLQHKETQTTVELADVACQANISFQPPKIIQEQPELMTASRMPTEIWFNDTSLKMFYVSVFRENNHVCPAYIPLEPVHDGLVSDPRLGA